MSAALFFSATVGEDSLKFRRIIGAEVRRHLHSGDDDFESADSSLSLLSMIAWRFAFSTIGAIRAIRRCPEREDENVDLLLQQPIDPAQTARGRVAAHAGVDRPRTARFAARIFCSINAG